MGLKRRIKSEEYETFNDIGPEDYIVLHNQEGEEIGLIFKCPGCGEPLAVNESKDGPSWKVDVSTLTASPSILHKRDGLGCGWHGYLTNGEFNGKIE